MLVLVDYDNTPGTYRTQPTRLITDLIGVLARFSLQFQNLHFRLYGGWDTYGGVATQLAQTISVQLQGTLPYSVPSTIPGGAPALITAELVRSSLWVSIPLVDTFRPRNPGQRGIRCVVPAGCASPSTASCHLHSSLSLLNQAQCSTTCAVQPHDAVARNEQKQVDTCITVDLIHQTLMNSEPIALVSSDDDLWPGIFACTSLGVSVVHVHTRNPSACSNQYETTALARGYIYKKAKL
jgi:uncharacterized LabA/DUF88 family protein